MSHNFCFNGSWWKETELLRNKENRTFLKYVVNQRQENENHNSEIDKICTAKNQSKEESSEKTNIVNEVKTNKIFCGWGCYFKK